jgi:hypothetical protein
MERNANAKIGDSKAAALVQDAIAATKPPAPQIPKMADGSPMPCRNFTSALSKGQIPRLRKLRLQA